MRRWWRRREPAWNGVSEVSSRRHDYARLDDCELKRTARAARALPEVIAAAAAVAERVLGVRMFDEQVRAAIALTRGRIVEMQTGEGKTLAAVPAIAWYAREGRGVHVLTANDYLAARDAEWMGDIYAWMGLTVASIGRQSTPEERRAAYRADITYTTANEVGFDYLRDGLAFDPADEVHRGFAAAVIDEADSLLIDEARVPLVIAGAAAGTDGGSEAALADGIVRRLVAGVHFTVERQGGNASLTPAGVATVERASGRVLFAPAHDALRAAVYDALHAHALLRRDVDYVVADGRVLSVDEFKGRVVRDRRWPPGLQTAIEVKEGVSPRGASRVLGSITVEHLVALYDRIAGMTGTAATQADEIRDVYGLEIEVIPTHRPIGRVDHPDEVFATSAEKVAAIVSDIRRVHAAGRPILIGTPSVEASEQLSARLADVPHHVLNARNEAAEAAIVARAGERGAVTISTNMAGRGVDIRLGPGVAALGGLYVIGTGRHDSRRIDHQLRGRAGRQGDPGSSRFFVSCEDPLLSASPDDDPGITADQQQRIREGRHLDARIFLRKYESVLEAQRRTMAGRRHEILHGEVDRRRRAVMLATHDDLWSDYLAAASDLRSGSAWISLGYGDPLGHYLRQIHQMFAELARTVEAETAARLAAGDAADSPSIPQRGATWTYLTTDEPFGPLTARVMRTLVRRISRSTRVESASSRRS
jgi:preprotein translocase subunit SecA